MIEIYDSIIKCLTKIRKRVFCKFKGIKIEQEKHLCEILVRIFFLYFAKNSIYIVLLTSFFIINCTYIFLTFPIEFWAHRNVLFGLAMVSLITCFSLVSTDRNELATFFDVSMELRTEEIRGSLRRTLLVILQAIFGIIIILISLQLHFHHDYDAYDILLTILFLIIIIRFVISIIIWTNCALRFAESLGKLQKLLDKCHGKTEIENFALRMKGMFLSFHVLQKAIPRISLFWFTVLTYLFLLRMKGVLSTTVFLFLTFPFLHFYCSCCFVNRNIKKLKLATLRLFDLQFITPATNSVINYFWMSRKIEGLPLLEIQFLFNITFSNFFKIIFYITLILISFQPCINAGLNCKKH